MSRTTPAVAALLCVMASPALAHHPMGGTTPATLWHGLLSGLGHPIFGPDHLMFVLALGVTAAFAAPGLIIPGAFIVATMLGVLVHAAGVNVPMAEALVGATLVVIGAAFLNGRQFTGSVWLLFAGVAGILHGYAFGEGIVGADRGVFGAYLAGLAGVQFAIAAGMAVFTRHVILADGFAGHRMKAAGGALIAMGMLFVSSVLD